MKEKNFIDGSIQKLRAKKYLKEELDRAGLVNVDIRKTPLGHRIHLIAEKPGLVIGKKGKKVDKLKKDLEEEKGFEKVEIEVDEVEERNLHPELVISWIKKMLQKGQRPNRATKRALDGIMDSRAMGAEIVITGVITGANAISRKEKASAGYLKKAGEETKKVRKATGSAVLPQGKLGIKVRIVPPGTYFRDKIDIEEYVEETEIEKEEEEDGDKENE